MDKSANSKPRQLYVTSKEFTEGRHLIGILTELSEGNYQFEYKLDGKFQEWYLLIKEFPDPKKVYNGSDVERFINRLVPKRSSPYLELLLESANLKEYNEWEMIKVFGLRNMKDDAFLFEKLPERVVIYEPVEAHC